MEETKKKRTYRKIDRNYNNDGLKTALEGSKEVYADVSNCTRGLDDEQMAKLKRFNDLDQYEKDILLLTSTKGKRETAKLYGISEQYVHKLLHKIHDKLNGQ